MRHSNILPLLWPAKDSIAGGSSCYDEEKANVTNTDAIKIIQLPLQIRFIGKMIKLAAVCNKQMKQHK